MYPMHTICVLIVKSILNNIFYLRTITILCLYEKKYFVFLSKPNKSVTREGTGVVGGLIIFSHKTVFKLNITFCVTIW